MQAPLTSVWGQVCMALGIYRAFHNVLRDWLHESHVDTPHRHVGFQIPIFWRFAAPLTWNFVSSLNCTFSRKWSSELIKFCNCKQKSSPAAEMWTTMKNNLLGKKILSCSVYLYRFRKYVSYGFPIINFCNPGVHYETPCILLTSRANYSICSGRSHAVQKLIMEPMTMKKKCLHMTCIAWLIPRSLQHQAQVTSASLC
jgi:hypothetical protein